MECKITGKECVFDENCDDCWDALYGLYKRSLEITSPREIERDMFETSAMGKVKTATLRYRQGVMLYSQEMKVVKGEITVSTPIKL